VAEGDLIVCGIAGYADMAMVRGADPKILTRMAQTMTHRGPDSDGFFVADHVGLAVRRLSIVDLRTGDQPIANDDGTVVVCCNGEIFNHQELREELRAAGHRFHTSSDVEVLVHLYEDLGTGLVHRLNGQFSFAIYDRRRRRLVLARDHVGITPLHYAVAGGTLIFGSEIKALLAHPAAPREVDLTGLDQVLVLPGLVSPRTMFRGISSLPPGRLLVLEDGKLTTERYWDLDYPLAGDGEGDGDGQGDGSAARGLDPADHLATLERALLRSVELRMRADVPHAYYLSGGLDSSLVAAMASKLAQGSPIRTFSVVFPGDRMSEQPYQRLMAASLGAEHTEVAVTPDDLRAQLADAVWHCECPLKESYNVASLRLSRAVREHGTKVVLTGEGADELFAGYVGYKFDKMRAARSARPRPGRPDRAGRPGRPERPQRPPSEEERLRARLWGNPQLGYGRDLAGLAGIRRALYSPELAARQESFSCLDQPLVDITQMTGRHILHQRSYLDFKLRLADHLLGDHGDRVALANSVETRYPYLDLDVIDCARAIPPDLTLRDFEEKHMMKRVAGTYLPMEIVQREKFAFHAHASPELVRSDGAWIDHYLSPSRIRREGYFNPEYVGELRRKYTGRDVDLDLLVEDDVLMVVITHGMFLEAFDMPGLS
jgi:asparagine synthase (glutamine-hydrolysing)